MLTSGLWRVTVVVQALYTLSMCPGCGGCGISTHVEIGHIAATIFQDHKNVRNYRELILKHQDAYQAGNTYPDSYYSSLCLKGKYSHVSEDTHWTAFTNVTLQYIRHTYPPPWNEDTEKLVVFMLGVVSHQVADITWHGLSGIRQGFIRTMAAVDFHGLYDTSHSAADLGGDVINEYRGDYSYIQYNQWYIPVKDLSNIYKLYYGKTNHVTSDVIEECTALTFLAVLGERIALGEIYSRTAKQSPFLTQQLDSFFLGGMYDMALWTTRIWDNVIHILEHGFEDCLTPDTPLFITCNTSSTQARNTQYRATPPQADYHSTHTLMSVENRRSITRDKLIVKRTYSGAVILRADRRKEEKKKVQQTSQRKTSESPSTILYTKRAYSRLGKVVLSADVNNDNITDLVVSAPMYPSDNSTNYQGRVFVLYGTLHGVSSGDYPIEDIANVTLRGPDGSGARFGTAVSVIDINLDGYKDIVVSSPNVHWDNLTYTGGLSAWYGNKNGSFSDSPSIVYRNKHAPVYDNLGVTLLAADVDLDGYDDLLVGSPLSPGSAGPQSGRVCVMKSSKSFSFSTWKCIRGPGLAANTSWFGSSMVVSEIKSYGKVLIVSAPIYRQCYRSDCKFSSNDTQAAGQVTIWKIPELSLVTQITGSTEHSHYGSSLAVGYPYTDKEEAVLAVGMDSIDIGGSVFSVRRNLSQVGAVATYNLSTLLSTDADKPTHILYGDRQFSMFGSQIEFVDIDNDRNDDLIVGAPHFTDDLTDIIYGAEQGEVMVFSSTNGQLYLDDTSPSVCAHSITVPCPSKLASKLLSWKENKAHLGSNLVTLSYNGKNGMKFTQTVVSAIRSSYKARQSGAVLIYNN